MGMNFYLHDEPCPHCGHEAPPLHIGKSSGGWYFALHVIPEAGLNDLEDWRALWSMPGKIIRNEDGDVVSPLGMLERIVARSWPVAPGTPPRSATEMRRNYAEEGEMGLLRSIVDGVHCVGHGMGTWDLCAGDFS